MDKKSIKIKDVWFEQNRLFFMLEEGKQQKNIKLDFRLCDRNNDILPTTYWQICADRIYDAAVENDVVSIDILEIARELGVNNYYADTIEIYAKKEKEHFILECAEKELKEKEWKIGNIRFCLIKSRSTIAVKADFRVQPVTCGEITLLDEQHLKLPVIVDDKKLINKKILLCERYDVGSSLSHLLNAAEEDKEGAYRIALSCLETESLQGTIDFYIEYVHMDTRLVCRQPIEFAQKEVICQYRNQYCKLYKNIQGKLSCYVWNLISDFMCRNMEVEGDFLTFPGLEKKKMGVFLCKKSQGRMIAEKKVAEFYGKIPLSAFGKKGIPGGRTYTLFMEDSGLKRLKYCGNMKCQMERENIRYAICCDQNGIFIEANRNAKKIKLAVWGSCYSRNAFSAEYNPEWRDIFSIEHNYFWPSLFSIASNPVTLIEPASFLGEGMDNAGNVRRELKKTAIEELKQCQFDYFLLDFYADAVAGVRRFTDGTCVGQGPAFCPNAKLMWEYEEIIQKNTGKFDYRDKQYFEEWKKSCDIFCERLKEIGCDKKVILVEGYFNTKFIDGESGVREYHKKRINGKLVDRDFLNGKEKLWKQMNQYFVGRLPDTVILNISQYHYFADWNHRLQGPHHFERNYYKTFLAELCKLILTDR